MASQLAKLHSTLPSDLALLKLDPALAIEDEDLRLLSNKRQKEQPAADSGPVELLASEWNTVIQMLRWQVEDDVERPGRNYSRWMKNNSHSHKIIEVVTCLRGCHCYGVNGKAVHFTPGVVALIDRETLHDAVYSDHHNSCVDFWLHFYPSGHYTLNFVYHTPRHPQCIVPVQLPKGELTEKLKQAGAQLYESDRARARLKHQRHFLYLLHELFEALESSNVTTKNIDNAPIIDSVKQYIEDHLDEPLTLQDLADAAGYSPFHFHRIFLEAEGVTPRKYVEMARLKRALELLKKGNSITSVALDVGFSTHAQFDRVFKRQFNCSPSHWASVTQPA